MGSQCCRTAALEKYDSPASPSPSGGKRGRKHWNRSGGQSITFASFTQGGKSDQSSQDELLAVHKLGGHPHIHLFAVFDGHGEFVGEVSLFLKRNFPTTLQGMKDFPTKPVLALKDCCVKVNNLLKVTGIDLQLSGSTGCICLIINNQLFTCNVGDSRAIAAVGPVDLPVPVQLTTDHTASNPKEKHRILKARGRVIKKRIYTQDGMLPGLIPSRSFGDLMGGRAGVVCQPDVCVYTISSQYRFLVLMSDGVWENVAAAHIAKHVVLSESLAVAAREIVKDAERAVHAGNKYRDDMTAVLVAFHGFGESAGPTAVSDRDDDFIKDPDDRVAFVVSICEELISQGVHPEDAPDAIMGLTEDQRQRVVHSVGVSRCEPTTSPGAVHSNSPDSAQRDGPSSTSEDGSSSGGEGSGRRPWYKSWLGGDREEEHG